MADPKDDLIAQLQKQVADSDSNIKALSAERDKLTAALAGAGIQSKPTPVDLTGYSTEKYVYEPTGELFQMITLPPDHEDAKFQRVIMCKNDTKTWNGSLSDFKRLFSLAPNKPAK